MGLDVDKQASGMSGAQCPWLLGEAGGEVEATFGVTGPVACWSLVASQGVEVCAT